MLKYVLKRLLYVAPTMFIISLLIFATIQLPPGDYVTNMIESMRNQTGGATWSPEFAEAMRNRYGLNEPLTTQYAKWIGNIVLRGDFGYWFQNSEPAEKMIGDRIGMTLLVSFSSFIFTWVIALPIGVLSAVRQYSLANYFFSFVGFLGLAMPGFLVALLAMYLSFKLGGASLSGLFSSEFENAPWSIPKVFDLLRRVGIPKPEVRVDEYLFRLSGGMRQRCMIAMALSCQPALLIADEPTTALDVTTQAQILDLMLSFKEDFDMSILFITHDLGVVAEIADDVAVMYLGNVVECGDVDTIFNNPHHPYTTALLESIPKISATRERLDPIKGMVPSPFQRPSGCAFHPRCKQCIENVCNRSTPQLVKLSATHEIYCHLYDENRQPVILNEAQHG